MSCSSIFTAKIKLPKFALSLRSEAVISAVANGGMYIIARKTGKQILIFNVICKTSCIKFGFSAVSEEIVVLNAFLEITMDKICFFLNSADRLYRVRVRVLLKK